MTKVYVVTLDEYDLFDESKRYVNVEGVFVNKTSAQKYVDAEVLRHNSSFNSWHQTYEITEAGVVGS